MNYYYPISLNFLKVSGEKSSKLLHGQLTNDINALKVSERNSNLFLAQKGKIIAEVDVLRESETEFFLAVSEIGFPLLKEKLVKISPLSKVKVEDISEKYRGYRFYEIGKKSFNEYVSIEKELPELSFSEKEKIRIQNFSPEIGIDFDDSNFPQEARLDYCLNYEKGCYLGQEIIARLHFRGHVNKLLCSLKFQSAESQGKNFVGKDIFKGEKKIGRITSSVYVDSEKTHYALGYLPYKLVEEKDLEGIRIENEENISLILMG